MAEKTADNAAVSANQGRTFRLPRLTRGQQKYLDRIKHAEENPDLTLRFGPGPRKATPK